MLGSDPQEELNREASAYRSLSSHWIFCAAGLLFFTILLAMAEQLFMEVLMPSTRPMLQHSPSLQCQYVPSSSTLYCYIVYLCCCALPDVKRKHLYTSFI